MAISLLQKLVEIPVVFLDVETTGASAEYGDRVIELAICRVEGGKKVREYAQLFDPQRRVTAGITAITGITNEMVAGKPVFGAEVPGILEILDGAIVVGHNVRFDLSFLHGEFRRTGKSIVEALGGDRHVLDTVGIARRRFGRGGNGLQRLARNFGYEPPVAHRALADVYTTIHVFERLLEAVGGWEMCLCDAMREQGGAMGLLPANSRESLMPLELEEALEGNKPVEMEYLDANEQRTKRVIRPLHVKRRNGELILVAHCQLRDAQRTFKLDRIIQLARIESLGISE
ncbi:MAG TPA: exonuclease domain-containing protein [Tepidisphaeraceae bacterium]|nr:exonuclease domain-containing protein [Tepidisphaeraceae bacterium]